MTQLDGTGMKRLHREWRRRTEGRLALVLDGVGNPFNVGAVVRTAAAERVDHLYLGSATAPDHDKVNKTALGTARYLTWTEFDSGVPAVEAARADGYQVIAIELTSDALSLHEIPMETDVALVIGHEDRGCTPATLAACDGVAFIPSSRQGRQPQCRPRRLDRDLRGRRRSWSR